MFRIGQYIVYSNFGICRVEAIGKLNFIHNTQKEYYTLRPPYTTSNERIYVPVNSSVFMRNAITREEAFFYLDHLKDMEVKVVQSKKPGFLAAHYQELINTSDINGYLRLFKEIYQKEKLMKNCGKKLGQVDLRFYQLAERMLSKEFSIALQETPDCSKKRLCAAASCQSVVENIVSRGA